MHPKHIPALDGTRIDFLVFMAMSVSLTNLTKALRSSEDVSNKVSS